MWARSICPVSEEWDGPPEPHSTSQQKSRKYFHWQRPTRDLVGLCDLVKSDKQYESASAGR